MKKSGDYGFEPQTLCLQTDAQNQLKANRLIYGKVVELFFSPPKIFRTVFIHFFAL